MKNSDDDVWPSVRRLSPIARVALLQALAIVSGVLFAFSLPPHDIEGLAWFAFVPLLIAVNLPGLRPERSLYVIGTGLITGMSCAIIQAGWNSGKSGTLQFAYLPYIWISLVIGVVAAFGSEFRKRFPAGGVGWIALVACAGVTVEWVTTFSPLPVGIALSQYRSLPVIQVADITGIWGVTFLLWMTNASLVTYFLSGRERGRQAAFVPTIILGGCLLYGVARLKDTFSTNRMVTVAAIQDFSGADSGGFAAQADSTPTPEKETLIRDAAAKGARLIVGTEMAWGAAFRPNDPSDGVSALARETRSLLVIGFEQDGGRDSGGKNYNSAALVGPDGSTLGIHHKKRLFLGERQSMRPGIAAHAYVSPIGKIGLLICFDSCYTDSTREAVADGARIIAMPNYDPPTPNSVLHSLHAALMPFRAVENRVAFIRADPNGRSQIIAPTGRIVAETPMYRPEALVASVAFGNGRGTFFTRWGDWLAYLCAGVTALVVLMHRKHRLTAPTVDSPA
jgi:apolipoprotein N-acyltransferase